MSPFTFLLSVAKPPIQHLYAHWVGWSLFWLVVTVALNVVTQIAGHSPWMSALFILFFQIGFIFLMMSIYHLHLQAVHQPFSWKASWTWLSKPKLASRGILIGLFYLAGSFLLSVFASAFSLGLNRGIGWSINNSLLFSILFFFLFNSFFQIVFWRLPSLSFEFPVCYAIKQSLVHFSRSWKAVVTFFLALHIPILFSFSGAVWSVFASPPKEAIDFADFLSGIPMPALFLLFGGMFFQLFAWLVILMQGYSPSFWSRIDDASKTQTNP